MLPDLPGNVYQLLKETIMKIKYAATALVLLSSLMAGTSFAADADTATAAGQVIARLPQVGDVDVFPVNPKASTLSRDAVRAEARSAQQAGVLPQVGDADVFQASAAPSTLTRQAVKSEYLTARKAGTLPLGGEQS